MTTDPSRPSTTARVDLIVAFACAGLCLGLYLATLAPGVYWHDSAEYAALAVSLQMPHPPCHPVYIYLAHVFTYLPFEPAYSLNLMSALAAGLAIAIAYLAGRGIGLRIPFAAAAALALGVSRTFWSNAVVAEVYGLGLCFVLLALVLLLRAEREQRPRHAVSAALLAGFGTGAHLSVATAGLGFVALAWQAGAGGARVRVLGACALAALSGAFAAFLLIPLSAPASLLDLDHWTWALYRAGGAHFWSWFAFSSIADPVLRFATILRGELGLLGLLLALVGGVVLSRERRPAALALGLVVAGNAGFFLFYKVFDPEPFFLPSFAALFLLAGAGLQALVVRWPGLGRASFAVLLLPIGLAVANHGVADRSADRRPQEFIAELERSLPRDSVLLTYHDPPEWQLWSVWFYAQEIHDVRPDVVVRPMPDPVRVRCYVEAGVPVFAFIDQPRLRAFGFALEPTGPVQRVGLPEVVGTPRRTAGAAARARCETTRRR